MGTAEEGCKEAQQEGTNESGICTHRGGLRVVDAAKSLYAKGEGQRQSDDTSGDAAEDVALEVVKFYHGCMYLI